MTFILLANMSPLPLLVVKAVLENPRLLDWPWWRSHWHVLLRRHNTVVFARGRDVHYSVVVPVVQEIVVVRVH